MLPYEWGCSTPDNFSSDLRQVALRENRPLVVCKLAAPMRQPLQSPIPVIEEKVIGPFIMGEDKLRSK